MTRPDAILYSIAFYSYLAAFFLYIFYVGLKKEKLGKIATILMIVGCIPHAAAFFVRWVSQGHIPLANMYEYMGLMSWMVVVSLLYFIKRYKNHKIGVFLSPVAVVMLVVASLLPAEINRQLMPALQSTWLQIHVTMAALGSGAFLISFATASLYLLNDNIEKTKHYDIAVKKSWILFGIFWVLVPLAISSILQMTSLIPISIHNLPPAQMQHANGSAVTSFMFKFGESTLYHGRFIIGLGMGMIVSSIIWPFFFFFVVSNKFKGSENVGARFFIVVAFSLLISAIIVGFLLKSGTLMFSKSSYFKIFEFFGPTLIISWVLVPVVFHLISHIKSGWMDQLGLTRPIFEEISYSAVAIGYPLYTIGALFAGAIWAEQAWGTWWSWDPKEVGALIIWLFYTGFLHARYQKQWKGNRAAILIVLGVIFLFVSFFGNYFFGGLHAFEVT